MGSNAKTARLVQQYFYEQLGDRIWDEFKDERDFNLIKQKIAYALFGPPTQESDLEDITELSLFGYSQDQLSAVDPIYNQILSLKKYSPANSICISVIFVCTVPENPQIQNIHLYDHMEYSSFDVNPLFRVRKCIKHHITDENYGCSFFVDDVGRIYDGWQDYMNNNKLNKGIVIAPHNGRYTALVLKDDEHVKLQIELSPASRPYAQVKKGLDIASTIGAIGSMGVMVTALFTPVGPVLAGAALAGSIGTGIYGIGSSAEVLHDRASHGQDIGIRDSQSRGCWINIIASTTGMAASASSALLSRAASSGQTIGRAVTLGHDALLVTSIITNGTGIVNSFATMSNQYNETGRLPSALEVFQLTSSILFFTNSVVSNRMASTIIKESQTSSISSVRDTLSSKQRKIFDKMCGETRRLHGTLEGNSEIIRSVNTIENRQQFFRDAARINKNLNENGVRISFRDGQALFNGEHVINPSEFNAMNNIERTQYLQNIGRADLSRSNAVTRLPPVSGMNNLSTIPVNTIVTSLIQVSRLMDSFPDIAGDDQILLRYISNKLTTFANEQLIYDRFVEIMNWLNCNMNEYLKEKLLIMDIVGTNLLMKLFQTCFDFFLNILPDESGIPDLLTIYYRDGRLDEVRVRRILEYLVNSVNREYENYERRQIRCSVCQGVRFCK